MATKKTKDLITDLEFEEAIEEMEGGLIPLKNKKWCKKNGDGKGNHKEFIPSAEFSLKDLAELKKIPGETTKHKIVDLIQCWVPLVVKLSTSYMSKKRPSKMSFAKGVDRRGTDYGGVGSGWIYDVLPNNPDSEGVKGEKCPVANCNQFITSDHQSFRICVHTARHVVYDNTEAEGVKCDFFYESVVGGDTIRIEGAAMSEGWKRSDTSDIVMHVHYDLGKRLNDYMDARDKAREVVDRELNGVNASFGVVAITISHPHGNIKQITIGEGVGYEEGMGNMAPRKLSYNSNTCPGSSGGLVLKIGMFGKDDPFSSVHWAVVHSGTDQELGTNHGYIN